MDDKVEILWRRAEDHWVHGRHHEMQRWTISNFVILTEGAILTFYGSVRSPAIQTYLPIFLIGLGLFGIAAVLKLTERFGLHRRMADALMQEIDKLLGTSLRALQKSGDERHQGEMLYKIVGKIPLFVFWVILHCFAITIGVVLLISAIG